MPQLVLHTVYIYTDLAPPQVRQADQAPGVGQPEGQHQRGAALTLLARRVQPGEAPLCRALDILTRATNDPSVFTITEKAPTTYYLS